jgi:fimbrial chaperone protein
MCRRISLWRHVIVAAAFAAAALSLPALAVTFGVKPVKISISADHRIAQIAFSSLNARVVVFDITAQRWTQDQNKDRLAPAPDVLVIPPVFSIAPYGTTLLRVAFRRPPAAQSSEQSYKIVITEVLKPSDRARPPVSIVVPLFVPAQTHAGSVTYSLRAPANGQAALIVSNTSTAHVYIGKAALSSGGKQIYTGVLGAYVLAGATRSFPITLNRAPAAQPIDLEFADDDGESQSSPVTMTP